MPAITLLQAESIISISSIEITGPLISSLSLSGVGGVTLLVLALLAFLALYSYGYLDVPNLSDFVAISD
jgi:hypothetical protein